MTNSGRRLQETFLMVLLSRVATSAAAAGCMIESSIRLLDRADHRCGRRMPLHGRSGPRSGLSTPGRGGPAWSGPAVDRVPIYLRLGEAEAEARPARDDDGAAAQLDLGVDELAEVQHLGVGEELHPACIRRRRDEV